MSFYGCFIEITELRNWVLLILGIVGAFVTIKTFANSVKQRKIDNTYKTLDFLRRHIGEDQIETFILLFHANNELSGVKYNEFKFIDGTTDTIETMFSEGGCGNGDIHNIIELFNLISIDMKDLQINIIWYEYGQIMMKIFDWTDYLEKYSKKESLPDDKLFYSNFNDFMRKNWKKLLYRPVKYYTYIE